VSTTETRHRVSVQALIDISHSALCCHSNKTCAPIANLPNIAQLGAPPTIPPRYIWVCAVVWECGEGHTHTRDHIHFTLATPQAKCN